MECRAAALKPRAFRVIEITWQPRQVCVKTMTRSRAASSLLKIEKKREKISAPTTDPVRALFVCVLMYICFVVKFPTKLPEVFFYEGHKVCVFGIV